MSEKEKKTMEIKLSEILQKLPQERRDKIEARAAELIAEHMTRRSLCEVGQSYNNLSYN